MSKTRRHFNKLSPAQAERLALLIEEHAEVVQAGTKILRHGYDSRHPNEFHGRTNTNYLEKEIGDAQAATEQMVLHKDINAGKIQIHKEAKRASMDRYLHHTKVKR